MRRDIWKGRRKAGILLQYSQELLSETEAFEQKVKTDFERERRKLIKKDSIRVLKWDRREGYNGDDFVQNMFSVVYTGRCYKIPLIVKRMILKQEQ
jgi:hypothetical protein